MLEIQGLTINYQGISALNDISANIPSGELVAAIGPNGAGKSTLLKAMLGLVPTTAGQVLLDGAPLIQQRNRVAYVPQRSQIDWDYPVTAKSVVMMARTPAIGWFKWGNRHQHQIVRQALERVEMWDLRDRQIGQLSGGQQQRIFIARALAQQASLLLMDEPLTGVDKPSEAIILSLMNELREEGRTIIVCSHEWGESLKRYDRLLLLNRTLLANGTPEAVMCKEHVQDAFGLAMQVNYCEEHCHEIEAARQQAAAQHATEKSFVQTGV